MSGKADTSLDLANLDTAALCERGAELELAHPGTGAPLGVFVTVAGVDSRTWRGAQNAVSEKRRSRRGPLTGEEIRAGQAEILARCTLAWRGVTFEGAELPCTVENARMLYARLPWMADQLDAFASDRASFLRD